MFRRNRRDDAGDLSRSRGAERDEQDADELADPQDEGELADYDDELDDDELEDDFDEDDDVDDDELEDDDGSEDEEPGARRARRPPAAARGEDLGDPATWTRLRDSAASARSSHDQEGPWDANTGYPEADRMDFGSLLVPARDGFDIQVNLDEEAGIWIAVVYGESALQLQAFAAPKTSGLWDEVRAEIAGEVTRSGGQSEDSEGPFGAELLARLTPDGPRGPAQWLRFMGADGPRWFLRGLITGPAAHDRPDLAEPFEAVFADVVVVRGDHAEPPRKALDIQLPEEARQAIEQMEAEGHAGHDHGVDGQAPRPPFGPGQRITEIH